MRGPEHGDDGQPGERQRPRRGLGNGRDRDGAVHRREGDQGKLNKARRGELLGTPPIGYVRLASGEWAIDPDEQVQSTVRLVFDQFDREATLHGLLRYLVHHAIRIPGRPTCGPNRGELEWRRPNRATLSNLLHHPSHAGAYRYGHRPIDPRRKQPGRPNTGKLVRRPEECLVLIRDRLSARGQSGAA